MESARSSGMQDSVGAFTWLSQTLSGVNTLRGVELDARHVLLHHLGAVCMVLLWILAYAAKLILALLPSRIPLPVLTNALHDLSTLAEQYDTASRTDETRLAVSKSPIGRALTQVRSGRSAF